MTKTLLKYTAIFYIIYCIFVRIVEGIFLGWLPEAHGYIIVTILWGFVIWLSSMLNVEILLRFIKEREVK